MRSYAKSKMALRRVCRSLGFDIHRIRVGHSPKGLPYEVVRPYASYAPWCSDKAFLDVYRTVEPHTLVDKYSCYELWTLVRESEKLEGALLEVGVW